jgi:PPOX class probable F420-dependent enzyme
MPSQALSHTALPPQIEQFIHDNPQGVLTSFRRNGMPQLSIVTVYPRDGGVGISITETRMKFKNLLRDPRCSVLVSHADWWSGFLVFEGTAEMQHSGNTDAEALRLARRQIYSATTRRRSASWADYDRITAGDKRVTLIVRPQHIYGPALAKMREAAGAR